MRCLHLLLLPGLLLTLALPARAELDGAFGVRFGEPLPDDLVLRPLPRRELAGERPPGRQHVYFDITPEPLDDDWVEVAAPLVPELLARHRPAVRFEVLLGDDRVPIRVRAHVPCAADACADLEAAIAAVLAERYQQRSSGPGSAPFLHEVRHDTGDDRVYLRRHDDGEVLLLDYLDVQPFRTWQRDHGRAIAAWHAARTHEFALGTRFHLEGGFGVSFDTPFRPAGFIPDVDMAVVVPAPWPGFAPATGDGIRSAPGYWVTLDPQGRPFRIRGRGVYASAEAAAAAKQHLVRALREQYGTLAKDLPRHSVVRVSGDWIVLRQQGAVLEMVFIHETGMQYQHERRQLARAAAEQARQAAREDALRGF